MTTNPHLPWSLDQDNEGCFSILDANGVPIQIGSATHSDRDIFTLIVRAVNAHAALLTALEDITNEAAHVSHDHWSDWVARLQGQVTKARAAIAKARS